MAPSIERFKTATLGRSYRCILPLLWTICKNISVEFLLVEGYLQGALQKELRIAPFVERFKTAFLGMSYWWILPALGMNWLKHWISVEFLLIENYLQGALRKELRIAPFVERFKKTALGRSCW